MQVYDEQIKASTAPHSVVRDLLRVGIKGLVLLALVLGTVSGIAVLIPEANDYNLATLLKHQRLAQFKTRKIVLVGGSNLAFGIDSPMIERATGCPVVNMGMNGFLGVRYMLEEVKDNLNPSDIVVLSFEHDNLYKTVDGASADLFAIVKANPSAFRYLTLQQQLGVLGTIPSAAQAKVTRLIWEAIIATKRRITGRSYDGGAEDTPKVNEIESLSGFTPEGDLVSHLGAEWNQPRGDGVIPKGTPLETQMIVLMRDFAKEMQQRGVSVVVSYTPVIREFYREHEQELKKVHALISASPPLIVPDPPSAFVWDDNYFFDTVYHLNARGRSLRTRKLIDDLVSQLHERALCTQTAAASAKG